MQAVLKTRTRLDGESERDLAQRVLNDPKADQVARDLAHLRLHHEEGTRGDGTPLDEQTAKDSGDLPKEWLQIQSWEDGKAQLFDKQAIAIAEDPLLRNKCQKIRVGVDWKGSHDVCIAHPKLVKALKHQLYYSKNADELASANAVMACLKRVTDRAGSVKFFQKAIQLRPNDWRLHSSIASSFMALNKTSLSLESLNRAKELTEEKSYDRFDVETCRGKILFNLMRLKEAKAVFFKVLVDAERYKEELTLTPLEAAHLIPIEYMLTLIWLQEKNKKMIQKQWESAEAKRKALPKGIHKRIDWNSRLSAASLMTMVCPELLGHQECYNCKKFCADPMQCSGCKKAVYCNPQCQRAHWKAGHKRECKIIGEARKAEKREQREESKKWEESMTRPPIDAGLDPHQVWAKAKKLSKHKHRGLDALLYFCAALFLDFSLDANDMGPPQLALKHCKDPKHPLCLAMKMVLIPQMRDVSSTEKFDILKSSTEHCTLAQNYLRGHYPTTPNDYFTESLDHLDQARFGAAMCLVFEARMIGRYYGVKSHEMAKSESDTIKQAFDMIVQLITSVEQYVPSQRWLTLQYEFGYSNLDVGAADEAQRWLQQFLDTLEDLEKNKNIPMNQHWKKIRNRAIAKMKLIPLIKAAKRNGYS